MSTCKRHGTRAPERSSRTAKTSTTSARSKRRARPLPRWLSGSSELDAMAQRRCLMILSVLSGERPVSDVIEELSISRGTYYQLEERALAAMLMALVPGSSESASSDPSAASPARRIAQLEDKVRGLERDKRRMERLLFLTRKVVRKGPVTTSAGRPKKRRPSRTRSSTTAGPSGSQGSAATTTTTTAPTPRSSTTSTTTASTPTSAGEAER